ncbi:hypothetical protein [Streptomyces aureus]|uniref:PE-PGRS family protein n=1 Tax=Streptomyces aureus TaxID=193461 RepID=A0ABV4T085_9ACTN
MSEYQYYEFLAVDRPLAIEEQAEVRGLSTRAEITATRFVNHYHFGDFRGDPTAMVARLYDAHLYFANWGSRRLLLRLPAEVLPKKTAAPYAMEESLSVSARHGHTLLDFSLDAEDGAEWDFESSITLADFTGLRAELAEGDLRPLYLAWLAGLRVWELADDDEEEYTLATEPPVPAGLDTLTGCQRALADFLRLDDELLAAAGETSAPFAAAPTAAERKAAVAAFVARLPEVEKNALLTEAALGAGAKAGQKLMARFCAARPAATGTGAGATGRRSAADLLDAAHLRRTERVRSERRAREAAEAARHRAAQEQRAARLAAVAAQPEPVWQEIDTLIEQRKPAAYDRAITLLADLRDASEQSSDATAAFDRRTAALRTTHRSKPALLRRLDESGVGAP